MTEEVEVEVEVDVLVPTRNRPDDLAHLLASAVAQTAHGFRMLIIDQSDDPGPNRALVERVGDRRIVHVVHEGRGKSLALNDGLRWTSAPIVAFTDDDCALPVDWIETSVAALAERPGAGLLFGSLTPFAHDRTTHFVPAIEFTEPRRYTGPMLRSYGLIGMGANMVARRSTFVDVGMFDVDLGPGGRLYTGEECELAYRVLRGGYDVVQDPQVRVVHRGARPVAGGVAATLVNEGFFAIGSGYGKNARGRDWRAFVTALHEVGRIIVSITAALARRRPPYHLRRLVLFVRGFMAGFRRGPRWPVLGPTGLDPV